MINHKWERLDEITETFWSIKFSKVVCTIYGNTGTEVEIFIDYIYKEATNPLSKMRYCFTETNMVGYITISYLEDMIEILMNDLSRMTDG